MAMTTAKKNLKGMTYTKRACLSHQEGQPIYIIDAKTRDVLAETDNYKDAVNSLLKHGGKTDRTLLMMCEDDRIEEDLLLIEKY